MLQDLLGVGSLPSIYGFFGAWLVLTLFTYPLVLLPVRSTLRRLDPQLEEAARAMGRTPWETFRTVVMPQLWPALAVGGLLVALFVMSDFGAVSIMRFDSFTSEIYVSYKSSFDRAATAGLGAVLVVLMVGLLWVSARIRNSKALHRLGPGPARPPRPVRARALEGAVARLLLAPLVGDRARAAGRRPRLLVRQGDLGRQHLVEHRRRARRQLAVHRDRRRARRRRRGARRRRARRPLPGRL